MGAKREDLESLMAAIDRLVRDANRLAAESLDHGRASVLQLVATRGGISPAELAEVLDLAPSMVIRSLRALEERELVTMLEDVEQRPLAVATAAGSEELRQVTDAGCDVLAAVLREWSAEEVRCLTASLTRLSSDWHAFQQASALKVRHPERAAP